MPHFEIHVVDVAAAQRFYSGLLGWSFAAMPGGQEVGYHLITAPGIGGQGPLTGGMMRRIGAAPDAGAPVRGATLTFEVSDCDERYAWALTHGGAQALPPTDYPGIGRCAYVEDGHGNILGLIAPTKEGQ